MNCTLRKAGLVPSLYDKLRIRESGNYLRPNIMIVTELGLEPRRFYSTVLSCM